MKRRAEFFSESFRWRIK